MLVDGAITCWPPQDGDRDRRGMGPAPGARDFDVSAGELCRVNGDGRVGCLMGRSPFSEASNVQRIAVGTGVACVVSEGRPACISDEWNSRVPADILGEVVEVAVDYDRACSLEKSGRVVCWSSAGDSAEFAAPVVLSGIDDAVQLAIDIGVTCARRRSGRVSCEVGGVMRDLDGITDAVSLDVDGSDVCAVHRDGTVTCWARKYGGEARQGLSAPRSVDGLAGAVQVLVNAGTICARLHDGTVRCTGRADGGRADGIVGPVVVLGSAP
jgi:hypothetical protein